MEKRIQRKKIQKEINRLNNIISYGLCDEDEIFFIKKNILFLQSELGYIK